MLADYVICGACDEYFSISEAGFAEDYICDRCASGLAEEAPEDFGCCLLGQCLMPGLHFPSECHTIEMYESYLEEALAEEEEDN